MKTAAVKNTLKAYSVEDINEGLGCIVFHFSAGKAKSLAHQSDDLIRECEWCDIGVRRNKEADKYITGSEPLLLDFDKADRIYYELGWTIQDEPSCFCCGLGQYENIPESICDDDGLCVECAKQEKEEAAAEESRKTNAQQAAAEKLPENIILEPATSGEPGKP